MIDQQALATLVQEQIMEATRQQVSQLMADPAWIETIEKRAVDMLGARIESRFSKINDDPDLNGAVQGAIRSIFDHGFVPDITRYVDSEKFKVSVDLGIASAVKDVIDTLSLDPTWLARVETMVNQQMHLKANRYISDLDIEQSISRNLDQALDRWLENNNVLRTPGINDQAQQVELTVMDGIIVVEGELASNQINIVGDASIGGCLTVKDLRIDGSIDVTEPSWNQISARAAQGALEAMTNEWRQSLINDIQTSVRELGIEFDQVLIDGQPLVQDGRLSSTLEHSNLRSLGVLDNLSVQGPVDLKSVTVSGDRSSALEIGTENGQTFVRTMADAPWSLRIGDKAMIECSRDEVKVDQLRIGGCRISFAGSVPGYRGQRGDIVFNTEPVPGGTFAWVCLGAFSWQSLKAAS